MLIYLPTLNILVNLFFEPPDLPGQTAGKGSEKKGGRTDGKGQAFVYPLLLISA